MRNKKMELTINDLSRYIALALFNISEVKVEEGLPLQQAKELGKYLAVEIVKMYQQEKSAN